MQISVVNNLSVVANVFMSYSAFLTLCWPDLCSIDSVKIV